MGKIAVKFRQNWPAVDSLQERFTARVLGIGGVFYKTASPKATNEWYKRVLGFDVTSWGGVKFPPLPQGVTVWTPFPADTTHFEPSSSNLMVNFVVDDRDGVLARAAEQGNQTHQDDN